MSLPRPGGHAVSPDKRLNAATLPLAEWAPRPQLRVRTTPVPQPRYPAIDIHNHLGRWLSGGNWRTGTAPWLIDDVHRFIDLLDESGVEAVVNLDGMWGAELDANLGRYDRAFPGRIHTFCQLDWEQLAEPDGVARLKRSLARSAGQGAVGLKVWKSLGLTIRDSDGTLILPDDARVAEVLAEAGQLGLPVLIHVADPIAFFEPLDRHNERLDELGQAPEWWFGDRSVHPSFDRLVDALSALLESAPGTTFIGAHAGCAAEDLDRVDRMLAQHPNFTIDIAGRMAELGRQPRRVKRLIEKHPDRVLFGTDIYPATAEQYALHYRFLESDDESFEYDPDSLIPGQGRWNVSALALQARLLEPLYRGNARRVLGLNT
ncbi:amidohydrolase family protein [Arthrobacter yangruifuii]|uniref:Amidohydrolase family protein n=1 Tax=Arthrobacter yangruifuii TaxID=2606616 RepID=A0A5N6MTP7_9MICC|nr:amidohydrolase family protein [Arthrobacter yangruifuii]KAD4060193.1 amidohydrolase family protein [Arthrobacter yangruifuii]